ncbi:hypothetical protein B9T25_12440 [Acinetobacter sp. ANC 4470]|uniref:YidB family protein n=1 Tax=Acinetobacter sp. ANC 4470 TaxID=1977881 RepID=UPI000A343128|nr:YidB family protein [Acinetobacter sp. ANC 4470]OTG64884.1 hypothetical protein B9T25_12440 [Acinetobacter sp. ANC 4470]
MTNLSNIVEMLAKQALGGNQQQPSQQGGLGGILGSVLGQMGGNSAQQSQQGGLGGILGSVLGQLGGGQQTQPTSNMGGGAKTLLVVVLPLVLAWIQKQGGIQGALDQLKGVGLTSQVDDWVSTGPGENANVDQQQVQSLFDEQDIEQVAQQAQVPKQDVYGAISMVLPQIIDSLTPQGEQTNKQEANTDIQQVMNLVSGFLKN